MERKVVDRAIGALEAAKASGRTGLARDILASINELHGAGNPADRRAARRSIESLTEDVFNPPTGGGTPLSEFVGTPVDVEAPGQYRTSSTPGGFNPEATPRPTAAEIAGRAKRHPLVASARELKLEVVGYRDRPLTDFGFTPEEVPPQIPMADSLGAGGLARRAGIEGAAEGAARPVFEGGVGKFLTDKGYGKFFDNWATRMQSRGAGASLAALGEGATEAEVAAALKGSLLTRIVGGGAKIIGRGGWGGLAGAAAVVLPELASFGYNAVEEQKKRGLFEALGVPGGSGFGGPSFDEKLRIANRAAMTARADSMQMARLQGDNAYNTAALAGLFPDRFQEIMAGRRLPQGAVVIGGTPRVDLMSEIAMGMSTGKYQQEPQMAAGVGEFLGGGQEV